MGERYSPSPKLEAKGTSSARGKMFASCPSPVAHWDGGGSCECYYSMRVDGLTVASFTPATTAALFGFNVVQWEVLVTTFGNL